MAALEQPVLSMFWGGVLSTGENQNSQNFRVFGYLFDRKGAEKNCFFCEIFVKKTQKKNVQAK
jgi:hypothetical protein